MIFYFLSANALRSICNHWWFSSLSSCYWEISFGCYINILKQKSNYVKILITLNIKYWMWNKIFSKKLTKVNLKNSVFSNLASHIPQLLSQRFPVDPPTLQIGLSVSLSVSLWVCLLEQVKKQCLLYVHFPITFTFSFTQYFFSILMCYNLLYYILFKSALLLYYILLHYSTFLYKGYLWIPGHIFNLQKRKLLNFIRSPKFLVWLVMLAPLKKIITCELFTLLYYIQLFSTITYFWTISNIFKL